MKIQDGFALGQGDGGGKAAVDGVLHIGDFLKGSGLNLFVNLCDEAAETEIMVENDAEGKEKALAMRIEELDLSVCSFNCLKRAGINTVGDLVNKSEDDMMTVSYTHLLRRCERRQADRQPGRRQET